MNQLPPRVLGLPPRAGPSVNVRILGSFPGHRSPISRRHARGIARWDVLHACRREGSLDQRIVRGSEEPNDLGRIVGSHADLRAILFNGRSVSERFHPHQVPRGFWPELGVELLTLPSTCPAHAEMPTAEVVRVWTDTLARLLRA